MTPLPVNFFTAGAAKEFIEILTGTWLQLAEHAFPADFFYRPVTFRTPIKWVNPVVEIESVYNFFYLLPGINIPDPIPQFHLISFQYPYIPCEDDPVFRI